MEKSRKESEAALPQAAVEFSDTGGVGLHPLSTEALCWQLFIFCIVQNVHPFPENIVSTSPVDVVQLTEVRAWYKGP